MVQSERVNVLGKAKSLCQVSVSRTIVSTKGCTNYAMFSVQYPTVLSYSLQLCKTFLFTGWFYITYLKIK